MFRQVAQLPLDYDLFKGHDSIFNWSPAGSIIFGNGAVKKVGSEVKRLGGKKVVVCTDEGLVKFGVAQKVIDSLSDAGIQYSIFDKCEANPSVETVEKVTALAKEADMLIGLGGGSSIDPAKAAAVMVTNGGNIRDYEGCDLFPNAPLPVIAIPTAAGTGAEVTCFAVVTDVEKEWKMAIGGSYNIASLAICDPELTASLPPLFTAATGMDALTHAIEGFISRASDPISDAILAKAIKLIAGSLQRATFKGEFDKDARYDMMMGSTMAGMGFINTILGIAHSMAHPLGAMFGVPHGVGNAICLPVTMEFNLYSNPDKIAEIAGLFGKDTSGMDTIQAAKLAVDTVYELLDSLPIPPLSDWNVTPDDIEKLSEEAMKGGDRSTNPRETTVEDFEKLYQKALTLKK
ncbi:iron-containing alcohol dehydrogenase [Ihubacter massiliensis]|uniref:Iron-containing alcohol dehydrogenase n=1 Tax=Hominibacterium faecale TaxID=2839743 RepID=A0A9J6QJI5_9FIRM|nr:MULTISPECIES: iron-containing alcohol dehydrogenase [Eubacteriales Family XIII. Incertae Sedis]MCO7123021.1 iron-containing alcohol dehydrogenase [Ihubacter massiliensis]MCU7377281.1 iron-containing alcohol dehydrogenase [Hominibacterium faecale]MDE8733154.1 iron-containing alcohol dehydrogenase [Eubacteriales bacterium DFI.9.88]